MIWIPKEEQELWEAHQAKLSEEEKRRQAYYIWNNFSMEGYEEYRQKLEEFVY